MEPLTPNATDSHASQTAAVTQRADLPQPQVSSPLPTKPVVVEDEAAVEQQWIQKAKEIIAQTKNDPFSQARFLMELKTEYLVARYGRKSADKKQKT